jgi:hypothetical protein
VQVVVVGGTGSSDHTRAARHRELAGGAADPAGGRNMRFRYAEAVVDGAVSNGRCASAGIHRPRLTCVHVSHRRASIQPGYQRHSLEKDPVIVFGVFRCFWRVPLWDRAVQAINGV